MISNLNEAINKLYKNQILYSLEELYNNMLEQYKKDGLE